MAKDTALESIRLIPKQITQAMSEVREISVPQSYKKARNIVVAGMGGSIYTYYVIKALFGKELKVSFEKVNNYGIPGSVNRDTLFIASSYSGTTEEVVYNLSQAHKRGAMCFAITTGGELEAIQKKAGMSVYVFDPKFNPSGQPRMGQGYMVFGAISFLQSLGYISFIDENFSKELLGQIEAIDDSAHKMADNLVGTMPIYVAADHLSGNAHIIRNQTNETAKLFASYNLVPELNHHLMEGLKNPGNKKLTFVFFDSDYYKERNIQRMKLTKEVVEKNNIPILSYKAMAGSRIAQFVEVLMWGGYMTYYLAQTYNENPNAIPWVDYFKGKLGKLNQ